MELKREDQAFVHRNEAGEIDAEITFVYKTANVIEANHTYVSEALRGQEVARKLVDELVSFARENELAILPTCSYVVALFQREDQYQDVVYKG